MKTKKLSKKLTLNKSTISNLSEGTQQKIKGGIYSVYPCEISAPQIVCDSVGGFTCYDCGDTVGCGTETCNCPVSGNQIVCNSIDGPTC